MKKILCLLLVAILSSPPSYGAKPQGSLHKLDNPSDKDCHMGNGYYLDASKYHVVGKGNGQTIVECKKGKLYVSCNEDSLSQFIPECSGKTNSLGYAELSGDPESAFKRLQEAQEKAMNPPKPAQQPEPVVATSTESTQTTPPDAGKILDTKTESGKKTDLSSQSVTGSTKQPTIDGTAAMQHEKGKITSGNVEKSSFIGTSSLGDDYGMGDCGSGNIFQQLACRAGVIGSGLKTVGYMIAGFGLIVFSFAAIFGKVKWPLFATIMFSCFLLSATVFVVNMMTKNGDSSWIGGIKGNGSDYYSDNATNVPATDSGGVPDGESPK